MGRLLLGDGLHARWRDVIHPNIVHNLANYPQLMEAGWGDLIEAPRLMGPSLHAFISRVLGHFSHRIVPWVVEREFSGRLIYAGGDDILCLAPANDALPLAARLQQLFSAAWVIDTDFHEDPWRWRRRDWQGPWDSDKARLRFAIPHMPKQGYIQLPITAPELLEIPVKHMDSMASQSPYPEGADGPVLPLLGPFHSLSTAIVYGHFKTPMGRLLDHASYLLNHVAKKTAGRRAVAMSHFSRNGIKSEFALPWSPPGEPINAHCQIELVQRAFANGTLPARLPYKLRELTPVAAGALSVIRKDLNENERGQAEDQVLRGLFDSTLETTPNSEAKQVADGAYALWRQGIRLFPDRLERGVDGLLLCRTLATGGEWEEE